MSTNRLEVRTAIVTGSGRNIGRAIVLAFARAGARVVENGHRDVAQSDAVVAEACLSVAGDSGRFITGRCST